MANPVQNNSANGLPKLITFADPHHEAVNVRLHQNGWRFQSSGQFAVCYQKPGTNQSTILVYGNRRAVRVNGEKRYKCDIIAELPPEDTHLWTNLGWNEHHHEDTLHVYRCIAELICLVLTITLYLGACAFIPGVADHWYSIVGAIPASFVTAAILILLGWHMMFRFQKLKSIIRILCHVQLAIWRGRPRVHYRKLLQTLACADDVGRAAAARLLLRFV